MVKGAVSLPGEVFERGYKGENYQQLANDPDFQKRATDLAGLVTLGGGGGEGTNVGLGGIARGAKAVQPATEEAVRQVKRVLSPESYTPAREETAGTIRAAGGAAARNTATTSAQLEPYRELVNSLDDQEKLALFDHIEGRASNVQMFGQGSNRGPALRALADTLKGEFEKRRQKLEAMPKHDQMTFVEEYLPHMWKDPNAAQQAFTQRGGGAGKQGSGASLRKRDVPTYAEGIAMGLEPLTKDPIELAMRYVSSMDRFIASENTLQNLKDTGNLIYTSPKTMGASGHTSSFRPPDGWSPLKGRGARSQAGEQAYAPDDVAKMYNRYISRGFHEGEFGNVVDNIQRASNATSAMELGLSGFHALNIATSGVASDIGRAVSNIAGGEFLRGLTAAGHSIIGPAREMSTPLSLGHKFEQVYLGRSQGTPDLRRIVDLMTEAGGRGTGKMHAPDYDFSPAGSFLTAWKRGALRQQMAQSAGNVKGPITGAKELGSLIGRTMETVSDPLFKTYIPRMKNAAFYNTMKDWLDANPAATHEEQVRMARKLVDAMDNRYGEMINDNVFWQKHFKQVAQIAMLSYSWSLGLFRQLVNAAEHPTKLSIKSPDYNPDLAGVVGAAIAIPTINAVAQYLATGKPPEDMHDLIGPRTGGTGFGATVPSTARGFHKSKQARVPERMMLPSHERDIFGWYFDPQQEFKNKFSALPRAGIEFFMPGPTDVDMMDYLKYVAASFAPISFQQLEQGQKKGSALGPAASIAGIRPAPAYIQDPKGYDKAKENYKIIAERRKKAIEKKQQRRYGGPQE